MKVLIIHCTYRQQGGEDAVVSAEQKLLDAGGIESQILLFNNTRHALAKLLLLPFNIAAYMKTKRVLKKWKPDVVHIHNLHFGASPSVVWAVKHAGLPIVMTLHNFRLSCPSGTLFHAGRLLLDSLDGGFPWKAVSSGVFRNSRLLTFWLAVTMQFHRWLGTWRLIDRVIVLNEHAKSILLRSQLHIESSRIVIKPNFIFPVINAIHPSGSYYLFAGRLTEEKGIRYLLDAFAQTPLHLKIAGAGPLEEVVKASCKKHDNIQYLGSLTKAQLLTQMQSATALVFPSNWFEGMPLIIIEALAVGLPVLTSAIGAMEQMIVPGANGLHFIPGNTTSLVEAVQQWESLPEDAKRQCRLNALRSYKDHYGPANNFDQLTRIYASAINPSNNPSFTDANQNSKTAVESPVAITRNNAREKT